MTRPDIHTLTGAYALDALSDEERDLFEEHLAVCDACAAEVAEFHATAARLGASAAITPPPSLRDAVFAEIEDTRQEAPSRVPSLPDVPRLPTRAWFTNLAVPAAAVVAIAVLGLAAIVANLNARLNDLTASQTQMIEVVAAPDAATFSVAGDSGESVRVVLSPGRGEAVFFAHGMAPAPDDRTMQLWLIGEEGAIPAGLFDVDERGSVVRVLTGDMTSVQAIGVTVEPEGGSPQPTTDPVMVVPVEDV